MNNFDKFYLISHGIILIMLIGNTIILHDTNTHINIIGNIEDFAMKDDLYVMDEWKTNQLIYNATITFTCNGMPMDANGYEPDGRWDEHDILTAININSNCSNGKILERGRVDWNGIENIQIMEYTNFIGYGCTDCNSFAIYDALVSGEEQ